MIADKTALRAACRRTRHAAAEAAPGAALAAARRLPPRFLGAGIVAGYRPQGSEADPGPLLARFSGSRVVLPVVIAPDAPLLFRVWRPGDPLSPDAAGVPSPEAAAPALTPDVVIVPLLAFDRAGGRLGQGRGYYDRTLAALRAAGPMFALGLAYAAQEVPEVPMGPHDARLDAILTETAFIPVATEPK